jgi:hypothetical protein
MRTIGYTTVIPEGSPNYVAPLAPSCPHTERYMAVHRVNGGGWGVVDRRNGRLLAGKRPEEYRYETWPAVQVAVRDLNTGAAAGTWGR